MKRLSLLLLVLMLVSVTSLSIAADVAPPSAENIYQDGPPASSIDVNFGVVGGYRWMRVMADSSGVPVYDRPNRNGNVLYSFTDGYNYVTPRSQRGLFTEINPGEWVLTEVLSETFASRFTGAVVHGNSGIPWGWILIGHYASATPGGPEVREAAFQVQRYEMTYFYNTAEADGWRWYDVGGGRWVKQTLVSKVQPVANPGFAGRWVAVDLYEQNLVAYEGGQIVFATLISSGLPGSDTNPGQFNVYARAANAPMDGARGGYGDYRLENVPYALYFDGDISLHGTYWHNRFGYRQSRGCVNLTISDARWLYEWLPNDAGVYVYYSQPY